jgi:Zn-dependent protease
MSLLLPAALWFASNGQYTFGGAKPVPVNSRKFRNYRRGDILVSAAGVTTNFFLAFVWALAFILLGLAAQTLPATGPTLATAQRMMVHGIWINLLLCFFNLIPVPPLDGSHLLYHALPARAGNWYRGLQRFGYLPLFLMLFVFRGTMGVLLTPVIVMMRLLGSWIAPYQIGSLLAGISST